jgi:hypothetical protein
VQKRTTAAWQDRRPVHGFRLPAGKSVAIVIGVVATGTSAGHTPGVLVDYSNGGSSFAFSGRMAITVSTTSCP